MTPRIIVLPLSLSLTLLACSDDDVAVTPDAACEILEPARLAAPPEGWSLDESASYNLHVLGDLVLYSFDDRDDPERRYWRLDRCTGDSAPFPSLTPDLANPYVVDTPSGRVLYAKGGSSYYVVDRLDRPGDDTPRKLAGLPPATGFDLNFCNALAELPYACFWRDHAIYTHAGDPAAPVLEVARDTVSWIAYRDAVLTAHASGELRRTDPFTGASELLLSGAQFIDIIDPGPVLEPTQTFDPAGTPGDARVLWQPAGEPTLYLRRVGDGVDIPLAVDPALARGAGVWPPNGDTVLFTADDPRHIVAAVRADTGAAIVVPEHVDYDLSVQAPSLTLAAPGTLVQALWDVETGALHPWYRSPDPAPPLLAYDGASVDYYREENHDPAIGSLWRVDLASGAARQLSPRISPWRFPVTSETQVVSLDVNPFAVPDQLPQIKDVEYLDLATGRTTPVVEGISSVHPVPGQGVIYLDARGPMPGIWAAPLP